MSFYLLRTWWEEKKNWLAKCKIEKWKLQHAPRLVGQNCFCLLEYSCTLIFHPSHYTLWPKQSNPATPHTPLVLQVLCTLHLFVEHLCSGSPSSWSHRIMGILQTHTGIAQYAATAMNKVRSWWKQLFNLRLHCCAHQVLKKNVSSELSVFNV